MRSAASTDIVEGERGPTPDRFFSAMLAESDENSHSFTTPSGEIARNAHVWGERLQPGGLVTCHQTLAGGGGELARVRPPPQ